MRLRFARQASLTMLSLGVSALFVICARSAAAAPSLQQSPLPGAIHGVVTTQTTIPLGGVRVSVFDGVAEASALFSESDGTFHAEGLRPGRYTVTASLEGFETVTSPAVVTVGQTTELTIDLRLALKAERVEVVANGAVGAEVGTLSSSQLIEKQELEQLAPGGGVQASLRLIAGVIEVPGGMAIKGGRPSQAGMQVGPGMFVDPATGLTQGSLPADAIDAVTVLPNPYAVEFGRFSSGLVIVQTRRAADRWKTRLNELDPGFRLKRETFLTIVGLEEFDPRLETGGPLVKDKLFVAHSMQYRYLASDVPSRPQDELVTSHRFSSFTRVDGNLSARHSLVGVFGFFPSSAKHVTLGTFTPPDATVDTHGSVATTAATERWLLTNSLFSETTVEFNRYMTSVQPRGSAEMELLPETTLGSFFNRQRRETTTYQVIQTLSGSSHGRTGLHLYKFGFDYLHTHFDGSSASAPVLIRRSDGTLARRLDFEASTGQAINSDDLAIFAQDRLQPNTRWYVEFGARLDRDGVIDRVNLTPRVGSAVLLNDSGTAVIRSGYGLFFERTPSAAGAFRQYEGYTDTRFAADGTMIAPPLAVQHLLMPDLRTSRSGTWDLAFDQRLSKMWAFHAGVIDRRGSNELIVAPAPAGEPAALVLASTGRSTYREAEFGVHFTAGTRADINATYARSLARADLNAFTNYFDAVLSPVIGENAFARARADAPNRLLARWRVLPTPSWLLVGVLDWRDGLPYSTVNETLDFVGPRNEQRFPTYFRVDLGLEHRVRIFGARPWIGIRADNALDSWLPADVQANVTSPAYVHLLQLRVSSVPYPGAI